MQNNRLNSHSHIQALSPFIQQTFKISHDSYWATDWRDDEQCCDSTLNQYVQTDNGHRRILPRG